MERSTALFLHSSKLVKKLDFNAPIGYNLITQAAKSKDEQDLLPARRTKGLFKMDRVSKDNYYLDIAETVAERSTCLRRKYGAIVKTTHTSTGYNGAARAANVATSDTACATSSTSARRAV